MVVPEYVEVSPAVVIFLIQLFVTSAAKAFPDESNPMPSGYLNVAIEPTPFTEPNAPVPAKVATTPELDIFRMRLLL